MNIKLKIITFLFLCLVPLSYANASIGSSPLSLLASIASTLQGTLNSLYAALTENLVPPVSTPTPATKTVVPSVTLKLGDKSVLVAILQQSLIAGGYLKSPATGVFDANTQAAVKTFQKSKNLPVTGYIKIAMNSLASSFSAAASPFVPVAVGATGNQAADIQSFLIKRGDLHLSATTKFYGALTKAGVEAFQKSQDLPQTGIVNQATFAVMNGR